MVMIVQQFCHTQFYDSRVFPVPWNRVFPVPWNDEELKKMNKIQRKVPSLLSQCSVPYPHTHHFSKLY